MFDFLRGMLALLAPANGGLRRPGVLLAILLGVLSSACANTRGGPVPYNVTNFGAPDQPKVGAIAADYRVGPGDVLTVTVFQVEDLSGDFQVGPSGNLEYPLIGAVAASGRTTDEIDADIEQRLGAKYLQSPRVVVAVKSSQGSWITVDGSVTQPGNYQAVGGTSLIRAIAMARGPAEDANPRRVVVFRTIDGQRYAAAFDLTDIRRGLEPDPQIYGGDIIVVDGSASRSRFRDIITTIPVLALFRPF